MKNAIALKPRLLPQIDFLPPSVRSEKLIKIKFKDCNLLGLRDQTTEFNARQELQKLDSTYSLPKIYTLISNNRKISVLEQLSNSDRIFSNFESFKWSELFFNFFTDILGPDTNQWVIKDILYQLDSKMAHYHVMYRDVKNSFHKELTSESIFRSKAQIHFLTNLISHSESDDLVFIFLCEILLISIEQSRHTLINDLHTKRDATLLLSFFLSRNLIEIKDGKVILIRKNIKPAITEFIRHLGRLAITNNESLETVEKVIPCWSFKFEKIKTKLEQNFFETSFNHS
jgi:hypothetical protein